MIDVDEAKKLFAIASRMAELVGMKIIVEPDGSTKLHHLYLRGDERRKSENEINVFRDFLIRNKAKLLVATGHQAAVVGDDPATAADALALLEWINGARGQANAIYETTTGKRFTLHASCNALVRWYEASPAWVLQAFRFKRDVLGAASVRLAEPGQVPELWGMEWGLDQEGVERSPPCPPDPLAYTPPAKESAEEEKQAKLNFGGRA